MAGHPRGARPGHAAASPTCCWSASTTTCPEARRRAAAADVRFAGDDPAPRWSSCCAARGAGGAPVGLRRAAAVEPVRRAGRRAGGVVDLSAAHTRLRMRKSDEEIAALRPPPRSPTLAASARWSRTPVAGCTEHELTARIEAAYVSRGGMHHIHYLGVTPMSAPERAVPAQWPRARRVAARGPADLRAQRRRGAGVLRAAAAHRHRGRGAEPEVLRLHEVAEAALDAIAARLRPGVHAEELVAAAERHRGGRLHHGRRPRARLRRGLPAAGDRLAQPGHPADARPDAGGRHDRRRPAQRRHAATGGSGCRPASCCWSPTRGRAAARLPERPGARGMSGTAPTSSSSGRGTTA